MTPETGERVYTPVRAGQTVSHGELAELHPNVLLLALDCYGIPYGAVRVARDVRATPRRADRYLVVCLPRRDE